MIDFREMEQRMSSLGCDCPSCQSTPMTHSDLTAPVVKQMVDYCVAGQPVLITPGELAKLAATISAQALALDTQGEDENEPSRLPLRGLAVLFAAGMIMQIAVQLLLRLV